MRSRDEGVAGFYVDLPALLTIMIGLSIFTVSIYSAHASYLERRREGEMSRRLDNFVKEFRNYKYVADSPGVFAADRLSNLNTSMIQETYPPDSLRYHYRIEIEDNSGYQKDHSVEFNTSDMPANKDIYAKSTSVIITDGSGRSHLARMTVYIWEVS